jgi:hypothetical protein
MAVSAALAAAGMSRDVAPCHSRPLSGHCRTVTEPHGASRRRLTGFMMLRGSSESGGPVRGLPAGGLGRPVNLNAGHPRLPGPFTGGT